MDSIIYWTYFIFLLTLCIMWCHVCDSNSNSIVFVGNMINENCHLSSKVEIMISICLIAVLGISAVSATFFCSFPVFWRSFGCCFADFCGFSYFFLLFFGFLAGFEVLFCGFLRFQLLFSALFRILGWDLGCCFANFCGFSSTRPACCFDKSHKTYFYSLRCQVLA